MFEIGLFALICLSLITILVCRFMLPHLSERNPEPWYLDYARSFFPVLLLVFLLRGFIAEPFRIPSGSMLPTLEIGDFILVNKFTYGLRLPITHTKLFDVNEPERGDIIVFRYPPEPRQNYIKRLVGLPGDVIAYKNKVLYVNGERVDTQPMDNYLPTGDTVPLEQFSQVLRTQHDDVFAVQFSTLIDPTNNRVMRQDTWKVPEGQYFMMGDNRDNSFDSRGWGFVPESNIVGKAFFVWMNYDSVKGSGFNFDRIGTKIAAKEVTNFVD